MADRTTLLSHAILEKNGKAIERYLADEDTEINEIDAYGFTPLIEAAIVDQVDIAKLLIEHQADVNQTDMVGRTALHWAAENNNVTLCQLLLQHQADANAYTMASQSVLVTPLLRHFDAVKQLLYKHNANLLFAQDFINTKLLGHRYQLRGQIDIPNHKYQFIELDLEGFFLEFTLSVVRDSLFRYKNHFTARHLRYYFHFLQQMIDAFDIASELIKYQRYTIDLNLHQEKIDKLLEHDLLVIPVAYEGHAMTFVKYGSLLAKCDRGEEGRKQGGVAIYRITHVNAFNKTFIKRLIYTRHSNDFIHNHLNKQLGLKLLHILPLSHQITGNCSWANVEGCVALTLFLMLFRMSNQINNINLCEQAAMSFYSEWQIWDQDRALFDCIQSFHDAKPTRQASKAMLLAATLFQTCLNITNKKNVQRAEKILAILTIPEFKPFLQSYIDTYYIDEKTLQGKQLVELLNYCDAEFDLEGKRRVQF